MVPTHLPRAMSNSGFGVTTVSSNAGLACTIAAGVSITVGVKAVTRCFRSITYAPVGAHLALLGAFARAVHNFAVINYVTGGSGCDFDVAACG